MIFSVQRFLEDYFRRRSLADVDQYAVRVANLFDRFGTEITGTNLARVRTAFYRRNRQLNRRQFEAELAAGLKARFKKKAADPIFQRFKRTLGAARARLGGRRRSVAVLLSEFKSAVEAYSISAFWDSRKELKLRRRPEDIAQNLLAVFAKGTLGTSGLVLRELKSGIGFVDVVISFGAVLHLVEIKILQARQFVGANQLATYMRTERRRAGWLVLIDTRRPSKRTPVPPRIDTSAGSIRTVVIDINPVPPHQRG
jgi:Holliday junction resolvase-like predicted endonuclease